jgi:Tol biopolymer transport system component
VENIHLLSGAACGVYSPTVDGMLLYQVSTASSDRGLEFVDRDNKPLGRIGDPGNMFRPRVSPDGSEAVVEILDTETNTNDLWLVDLENGLRTRFTFATGDEYNPCWTPDGKEIVYIAEVDSLYRIMRQPVEGTGSEQVVFESTRELQTDEVSPDGKHILFEINDPESAMDQWMISFSGDDPVKLVDGERVQGGGRVSPDGRWLAYHGQTPGSFEIFVRPMTGGDRKWQVTRDGAVYPFWGPNGDELFYVEMSGRVSMVPVDGTGSTFRVGAPKNLMMVPPPEGGGTHVSLHPDGQRLLHVSGEVSGDERGYLRLVTDWQEGLAQ